MTDILTISIKSEHGEDFIPFQATIGSAGRDIFSPIDITIASGEVILIPTGLRMEIPLGYEIQLRSRSGLALKHKIVILNSPATIDSDYRGEIKVILINHGTNSYTFKRGERVAQMVLNKCYNWVAHLKDGKLKPSSRGDGGFGSTGA